MEVLLFDPGREVPSYLDQWDIFLPSDMWLGFICNVSTLILISFAFLVTLRFASIYKYDWNLFKKRFLGPDGVSWWCQVHVYSVQFKFHQL